MKLKTIRKLDVIYSAPNRNTSFRSLEEVMKHMDRVEKRLNELDEELKPLLDVKLVPVNAGTPDTIVFTDDSDTGRTTRPKVMKSENDVNVIIKKSDKNAVDKAYKALEDYRNIDRDTQIYLSFIEKERNARSYEAAKKKASKIAKQVKESAKNAEEVLGKIAEGYVDSYFKKFVRSVIRKVSEYYRGKYNRSTERLFPVVTDQYVELRHYLIFDKIIGVKQQDSNEDVLYKGYCIMFTVVLGGPDHRTYWVKVLEKGYRKPVPGDGLGHKAKDIKDAFNYVVKIMAIDGLQEQGYFPDIDFKRADWNDVANTCEIDEEGKWIRFKLKPGLPKGQQYKAAHRLGEILKRKILDMDYHEVHEIGYDIYSEKASNGKNMIWVEFTSDLKKLFKFSYTAIDSIVKMFPGSLNSRQRIKMQKAIQRISMEQD